MTYNYDELDAIERALEAARDDLVDDAERGISTAWLDDGYEENAEAFSKSANAILADAEDDKLGRIRDARRQLILAYAAAEAPREVASRAQHTDDRDDDRDYKQTLLRG